MGATVLVVDTKYFTQYKNGTTFASNPGDFTPNLAGSVMEKVKVVRTVNIGWSYIASSGNPCSPNGSGPATLILTRTAGNWGDDSFTIGDECSLFWTDNGGSQSDTTVVITAITGGVLVGTWGGFPTGSANGWLNASVQLHGKTALTALIYKFGILGNNETFNVSSKVSGSSQGYYSGTIGLGAPRSTAFQVGLKWGIPEDWISGIMRVRYVSNPSTIIQQFEIEHEFVINPFYLDGELSNLQNNIIPALLVFHTKMSYSHKGYIMIYKAKV